MRNFKIVATTENGSLSESESMTAGGIATETSTATGTDWDVSTETSGTVDLTTSTATTSSTTITTDETDTDSSTHSSSGIDTSWVTSKTHYADTATGTSTTTETTETTTTQETLTEYTFTTTYINGGNGWYTEVGTETEEYDVTFSSQDGDNSYWTTTHYTPWGYNAIYWAYSTIYSDTNRNITTTEQDTTTTSWTETDTTLSFTYDTTSAYTITGTFETTTVLTDTWTYTTTGSTESDFTTTAETITGTSSGTHTVTYEITTSSSGTYEVGAAESSHGQTYTTGDSSYLTEVAGYTTIDGLNATIAKITRHRSFKPGSSVVNETTVATWYEPGAVNTGETTNDSTGTSPSTTHTVNATSVKITITVTGIETTKTISCYIEQTIGTTTGTGDATTTTELIIVSSVVPAGYPGGSFYDTTATSTGYSQATTTYAVTGNTIEADGYARDAGERLFHITQFQPGSTMLISDVASECDQFTYKPNQPSFTSSSHSVWENGGSSFTSNGTELGHSAEGWSINLTTPQFTIDSGDTGLFVYNNTSFGGSESTTTVSYMAGVYEMTSGEPPSTTRTTYTADTTITYYGIMIHLNALYYLSFETHNYGADIFPCLSFVITDVSTQKNWN